MLIIIFMSDLVFYLKIVDKEVFFLNLDSLALVDTSNGYSGQSGLQELIDERFDILRNIMIVNIIIWLDILVFVEHEQKAFHSEELTGGLISGVQTEQPDLRGELLEVNLLSFFKHQFHQLDRYLIGQHLILYRSKQILLVQKSVHKWHLEVAEVIVNMRDL